MEAGKRLGRPMIDVALEKRIHGQLRAGKGMLAIAKDVGVGTGTTVDLAARLNPARTSTKEIGNDYG
jgi:hypothetical protein